MMIVRYCWAEAIIAIMELQIKVAFIVSVYHNNNNNNILMYTSSVTLISCFPTSILLFPGTSTSISTVILIPFKEHEIKI